MASYSFCAPAGWRVERNAAIDLADVCDWKKRCGTSYGDPPSGLAFFSIRPAEGVHGNAHYSGPREVVSAAPHAGLPAPEIAEVDLGHASSGLHRRCFVTRRLISWAGAWEEEYGLEVNGRLFWAWTRYEDDPKRIKGYRAGILGMLSSLAPN
jgi:hypothetical protein